MSANPVEKIKVLSEKVLSKKAKENALQTYAKRAKTMEKPGNLSVSMNHALTNAAHRLTLVEKRIMMIAVGKVDSRKRHTSIDGLRVTFTASDYAKAYSLALSTAYDELERAVERLYDRTISWSVKHSKGVERAEARWIVKKHYHSGEGWVEVTINPEILDTLTGLQGKYTTYKLKQASALRSVYSWRLLEMLMQFKSKGWRQDDLPSFAHAIGAHDTYAQNFAQLRRWVIEPAVKELTEKDGWEIEWKPIKEGRKVVAVRFEFKRSPQGSLTLT